MNAKDREPWVTLDELTPLRALRKLAGLSLSQAARIAGLKGHTSIQGLERLEGRDGGSTTIGTFARRARAWGFEYRIQVRRVTEDVTPASERR